LTLKYNLILLNKNDFLYALIKRSSLQLQVAKNKSKKRINSTVADLNVYCDTLRIENNME
jgi:hypothetical protein